MYEAALHGQWIVLEYLIFHATKRKWVGWKKERRVYEAAKSSGDRKTWDLVVHRGDPEEIEGLRDDCDCDRDSDGDSVDSCRYGEEEREGEEEVEQQGNNNKRTKTVAAT
jgi:hypothetical protein